jgi:hypothetical protein
MWRLLLAVLALLIAMTGETVEHINTTPYFLMGDAGRRLLKSDVLSIDEEIERARHCPPCKLAAR